MTFVMYILYDYCNNLVTLRRGHRTIGPMERDRRVHDWDEMEGMFAYLHLHQQRAVWARGICIGRTAQLGRQTGQTQMERGAPTSIL